MRDLKGVFLHSKPVKILIGLKQTNKPKYASILSRDANCTYSHTVKVLNLLKDHNLVRFQKQGRKKIITLTDEGNEIAAIIERLITKLERSS